jgi:hypothetical protein
MAESKYSNITFDDLMAPAKPSVASPQQAVTPLNDVQPSPYQAVSFDDLMPADNDPMMSMPAGQPKPEATWGSTVTTAIQTLPERTKQSWQGTKMFGAASGSLDLSLQDPSSGEMGDVLKMADELKANPADEGGRLAIRALGGDPDKLLSEDWQVAGGERLRMFNNMRNQRLTTSNIWQESLAEYKRLQGSIEAQTPDFAGSEFGGSKEFVNAVMTASADMIPAIVASYLAGPQIGAAVIGNQVLGHTMGDSISNHGLTPDQAILRTVAFTAAEFAPEVMSLKIFTEAGGTVLAKILKAAGAEGVQEMMTEAVQTGLDWGTGLEDMTLGEYLQTIGYSGAVGAATGGLLRTPVAMYEGNTPQAPQGAPPASQPAAAGNPNVNPTRPTRPTQPAQSTGPTGPTGPAPTTSRTAQPVPTRPMPDLDTEPTFEELMGQGEQAPDSQAAGATVPTVRPNVSQVSQVSPSQTGAADFSDLMPKPPGSTNPPGAPVLSGPGRDKEPDKEPDKELDGQPAFKRTVYRGSGRADQSSAYNPLSAQQSILGDGRYYAFDETTASNFGPNVEATEVELQNPLVIASDQQWRALTKDAGWEFPNPTTSDPEKQKQWIAAMNQMIRARGHDGVVIDFDPNYAGDALPDGRSIKTLRNVFGTPQVVAFGQQQAASPRNDAAIGLPRGDRRDDTQTSLTGERVVLQNRDRSSPASIEQMRQIASNPDYSRVGFSRDFLSGAPVVEPGAAIPDNQKGRQDRITTASGRKVPIQYAVVEADQLLPSHDANGNPQQDYAAGRDGVSRVIAGNGRAAGLQQAWRKSTTEQYLDEMAFDADFHGIPSDVILGMNNPVLVRLMPQEEITADIADQTNTVGTAALSPAEQARNDARRVDVASIGLDDNGEVTKQSAEQFIAAMPQAEKAGLLDGKAPNKAAYDRLSNMIFATAYESDELLRLYAESADPEIRTILNGLKIAAPKMARLKDAGQYDIRGVVVEAAEAAVSAKRAGIKLADYVKQDDMARDPVTMPLLQMMADNIRSAKKIGEMLSNLADVFYAESVRPDQDMLGDTMKRSPRELLEGFYGNEIDDQDAAAAGQQGRPSPDEPGNEGAAADLDRPPGAEPDRQPAGQQDPAQEVTPPEEFDLAAQAPEDLRAKDEQEATADEAEKRAQIDRERELFGMQQPEGNVSGVGQQSEAQQGGLFGGAFPTRGDRKRELDAEAHQAATSPKNDLPEPTDAQKEAGNYKKGHVQVHGFDVTIENPRGSKRSGTDRDGKAWEVELAHHYGYVKRTEGADGEHVDAFVGPNPASTNVFVMDQIDQSTGKFDEHKILFGFDSEADALAGYLANFDKGWKAGKITPTDLNFLAAWMAAGDTAKPFAEAPKPGATPAETKQIGKAFEEAEASALDGDFQMHHLFDQPGQKDVVRLKDKAEKLRVARNGQWMSVDEAKAEIAKWKEHARAQGETSANANRVVLSFFDLTGEWSKPWLEAGYQVWTFDIQANPEQGDVNNFSSDFFGDWFGDFEGMDIYAVLAACPCTDFANSGARHFRAKDADGRTQQSIDLVKQTLAAIEYFRPAVWAVENPVGRIEELTGLPRWRLSFDPNHLGDPYTKKTLIWGRFNPDLPVAPVEPTEGSKMHQKYGGKSQATKNARSVTPEGFSYGFFMANNATDHMAMALSNKFDRLDGKLIEEAVDAGLTESEITELVEDFYYMDLADADANAALREAIDERKANTPKPDLAQQLESVTDDDLSAMLDDLMDAETAQPEPAPTLSKNEEELESLLKQRDEANTRHMQKYRDGSATRAQTTTHNARISNMNERIEWLRSEIKKERKAGQAEVSPEVTPSPKKASKAKAKAREMGQGGRPADGLPINPGDTFRTLSGRVTTPYPRQKSERYASKWLIDNAKAEAAARGDSFNVTQFGAVTPLKNGELTPADIDAMQMYLFEQQPNVPPPMLKPLAAKPLADISITREVDGKQVERTADAWVKDIDNRIDGMKQLFACVNKTD